MPRITTPIALDGHSAERGWSEAQSLSLVTHAPTFGRAPSDATEVLIVHDEQYLYLAARFSVGDPSDIRAASLTRDLLSSDDVFRVVLDSFNDNETAIGFATTPAGVRVDFAVAGDGEDQNQDFNTYWDVATERDERGWYAEIRIPFSSLRFEDQDGRVVMGLIVSRFSAAKNETSTFPALPPSNANPLSRPSIARKIILDGIRGRTPTYITTYGLSGGTRQATLDDNALAFRQETDLTAEAGLDIKHQLTSNLTLDVTLNTDFAQVEADDQQVNLNRFDLFFPEKRQFFQERAGLFAVPTGAMVDPSLLFHSRRIGLTDDGTPLRIYGGARAVGRVGEWDLGFLDMHTETGLPGETENHGALRLRRRIINDQSTVGILATSRLTTDGQTNVAYGVDSRIRTLANDYLSVQWAQSFDNQRSERGFRSAMARVMWERPGTLTSQGLAYRFGAKWSGPAFDPGLGFQPRSDFAHLFVNWRYGFFPQTTMFRSLQPSVAGSWFLKNGDGSIDSRFTGLFLNYELKSGFAGWLGVNSSAEDLSVPLELSPDAVVPGGFHTFNSVEFSIQPPPGGRFRTGTTITIGEFFDGEQTSGNIFFAWDISNHLFLGANYIIGRFRFPDRDEVFDADLIRARVRAAVNTHLSATAFVQYNQASDAVVGNLRLRYHFSEGRDFYLVFNQLVNVDRQRFDPVLPVSQGQAVLLKYTHTFIR